MLAVLLEYDQRLFIKTVGVIIFELYAETETLVFDIWNSSFYLFFPFNNNKLSFYYYYL